MRHLIILFIFFSLIFSFDVIADPVRTKNDWDLLDSIEKRTLNNIKIKDNKLYFKNDLTFKLSNSRYDIYLIKNNSELAVYNLDQKILYLINVKNKNIKKIKWKYGSLQAIFKDCIKVTKWLSGKIEPNYYLTKWESAERPKNFKCNYFIFGGRCGLSVNGYNQAIFKDNLDYEGDLTSIAYLKDGNKCNFYSKLKVNY